MKNISHARKLSCAPKNHVVMMSTQLTHTYTYLCSFHILYLEWMCLSMTKSKYMFCSKQKAWGGLNMMSSYQHKHSYVKNKTHHRLIFIMGIPSPGKDSLYIKKGPERHQLDIDATLSRRIDIWLMSIQVFSLLLIPLQVYWPVRNVCQEEGMYHRVCFWQWSFLLFI